MVSTNLINANTKIKDEVNDDSFEAVNVFSKEMEEALKEVDEMISNPQKYPKYNNREDKGSLIRR